MQTDKQRVITVVVLPTLDILFKLTLLSRYLPMFFFLPCFSTHLNF